MKNCTPIALYTLHCTADAIKKSSNLGSPLLPKYVYLPGGCTEVSRSNSTGICQLLFKVHTTYNSFTCTSKLAAETGDGKIKRAGMGGWGRGDEEEGGEGERDRDREKETDTSTHRDRDRQRQRDRVTDKERQKEQARERERDRDRQRKRDRERERQREKEKVAEKKKKSGDKEKRISKE